MYSSNARQTAHNISVIRGDYQEDGAMFNSMSELRAQNKSIGHKFFNREIMKSFNSKVESGLFRGRWFIMSDKGREQSAKRKFKLWEARPNGEIISTGDASGYLNIDAAKQALKVIIRQSKAQ